MLNSCYSHILKQAADLIELKSPFPLPQFSPLAHLSPLFLVLWPLISLRLGLDPHNPSDPALTLHPAVHVP